MKIDKKIIELKKQMEEDKTFFWNHPEKGFEERETSKYIIERLKNLGYEIKTNIAKTGVMAILKGKKEKPCVLFRCEMDAIEMDEKGKMQHACGHDAHMTIMLALAELIIKEKENINGTVIILFQPAEETSGGAKKMIEEGVLENPNVDCVFALHVWSELKKGTIGVKSGPVMASTDPFNITVYGKEGHGAIPEKCIDPIYIASSIVIALQSIVGRNISSNENVVLGITAINGGNTNNKIPDKVEMKGICRTFNNNLRDYIKNRIKEVSTNIANSMNGEAVVFFKEDKYPALVNSEEYVNLVKNVSKEIVGEENIIKDYSTMCSEDFSYILQERKGAFFFVGCQDGQNFSQHSENFHVGIDEILLGTQIMYGIFEKTLINN